MGDRIYAEFSLYPFDRAALAACAPGAALLTAVAAVTDAHEITEDTDIPGLYAVGVIEANYGTAVFATARLAECAAAAGLFFRQYDEGSLEWDPEVTVCAPGRQPFCFRVAPASGTALLGATAITGLTHPGIDLRVSLDAFFSLAGMTLPQWSAAADSGALDRLLDLACPWA